MYYALWKIHEVASFEIMVQNRTGKSDCFKRVDGDSAGRHQPEKLSCPGLGPLAWFVSAFHSELWLSYINQLFGFFCFQVPPDSLVW